MDVDDVIAEEYRNERRTNFSGEVPQHLPEIFSHPTNSLTRAAPHEASQGTWVRRVVASMAMLFIHAVAGFSVDVGVFSASKLLPIENKDALFAAPPHFYGVFDGVSQCRQSRSFAQTLAKTACSKLGSRIDGDLMEQLQPALWEALGKAQSFSGCSTVCMVRLDLEQQECGCYNLGDSGCMVLRRENGAVVVAESSDAKMHPSGAPYQLGGLDWKTDRIEDGLTFKFAVAEGDVVICYTDGLSSNLDPLEIAQIVSDCAAQPAAELAKRLVEAARRKKVVDDDTTVVALRLVGQGSAVPTAPILTEEAPWEKMGLRFLG